MEITWLNAAAFIGVSLVALPILVHLFVRQQTRTLLFPSLRFLRETALAAFRRRRVEDALLLACRVAIVVLAALALAAPVIQTPARTAGYAQRMARAHIRVDAAPPDGGALSNGAFRFASFSRAVVADAIRDALRWLDEQPPASREIVFTGAFARGSIDAADLPAIPAAIGLRFVAIPPEPVPASAAVPTLTLKGDALALTERQVHFELDATRVIDGAAATLPRDRVGIAAAAADQPLADAALRSALEKGVRWGTSERRVRIVWEGGAAPDGTSANLEILRMPVPAARVAAHAVWEVLEQSASVQLPEAVLLPRPLLEAWARPPGPPSPAVPPADEGDRRWFWVLALVVLAVEQRLRRSPAAPANSAQEARVA